MTTVHPSQLFQAQPILSIARAGDELKLNAPTVPRQSTPPAA